MYACQHIIHTELQPAWTYSINKEKIHIVYHIELNTTDKIV